MSWKDIVKNTKDKCPKCGTPYKDPSFRLCMEDKCGHIPDDMMATEEELTEAEKETGFNFR